jgi:hypothetical protein
MTRIALILPFILTLAACAAPPPDRRIGSGEPDWGAIPRRIQDSDPRRRLEPVVAKCLFEFVRDLPHTCPVSAR